MAAIISDSKRLLTGMADASADTVKSGVRIGVNSVIPLALGALFLTVFAAALAALRASEGDEIQRLTSSPIFEAIANAAIAGMMASIVDVMIFDRLMLTGRMKSLTSKLMYRGLLFSMSFAAISLMTSAISGRLGEQYYVGSRSQLQKKLCAEAEAKAAAAATAACMAAKDPLPKGDPASV